MKRVKKFSFTLLEVLIALALIIGCMIPLIYPHVLLFQEQNAFVSEMKIDRLVQKLYGDTLVKLYRNEISWSTIEGQKEEIINAENFKSAGIPEGLFSGKYRWKIRIFKPKPPEARTVYLVTLIFEFEFLKQKRPPLTYRYEIFIERNVDKESLPEESSEKTEEEES